MSDCTEFIAACRYETDLIFLKTLHQSCRAQFCNYNHANAIYAAYDNNIMPTVYWLLEPDQMPVRYNNSRDINYNYCITQTLNDKKYDLLRAILYWLFDNCVAQFNKPALFEKLCRIGHTQLIDMMLRIYPELLEVPDKHKYMVAACYSGHLELAKRLDIISEIHYDKRILLMAFNCSCNHIDVATWFYDKYQGLINELIDIAGINKIYNTTLIYNYDVASWLYGLWPNVSLLSYTFDCVCNMGNVRSVRMIYEKHPDFNLCETGFLNACNRGHAEICDIMLQKNASLINNRIAQSSIEMHLLRNNESMIQLCRKYGINYEIYDKRISSNMSCVSVRFNKEPVKVAEIDRTCPICIKDDVEWQTACKHNFCKSCISLQINKYNKKCPCCRQAIDFASMSDIVF